MRIRPWLGVAFPLVLVLLRAPVGQAAEPFDVDLYARLLAGYTRVVADAAGTRVDYRGLTRSADWPRLLESLAESRPEKLATPAEKLAFWINAYNILTIDLVVQHYPVSSIKDVGSFVRPVWDVEAGVVGGKTYTLDQVEQEILRPLGEPRIHAAIVCASISCPPLRREPYRAAALDAQLDDSLRRWLSNPRKGARIDRSSRVITLSSIFKWFESDFEREGGVLEFLIPYLCDHERSWVITHRNEVRIRYFDYDWGLNDLAKRGSRLPAVGHWEVPPDGLCVGARSRGSHEKVIPPGNDEG